MKTNEPNDSAVPAEIDARTPSLPADDVYSSYIFSTSSRSLSKYGERLLMEVISVAQEYTADAALGTRKLNFGEMYKEKFALIDIPIRNLLNADDSTNYSRAKEAAVDLMKIYHTVEAPVLDEHGNQKRYKDGTPQYQFASFHLLDKVTVNQKPGIVSVKLGEETWSQILDMGKGYTRYNLLTAKSLNDVVAIRLFQILSNSREPLYFSIDRIKGILGLQDRYVDNPTGFIRRVIVPAEEEIREKCPFEVIHEAKYGQKSPKGRPSIIGLTFIKVYRPVVVQDLSAVLSPGVLGMLVKVFGFSERGLRSNAKLFQDVVSAGHEVEAFLLGIEKSAKQANSPQAYVVKSLQNLLRGVKSPGVRKGPSPGGVPPAAASAAAPGRSSNTVPGRLSVRGAEAFDDSELEEL